ncbi:M15 family metallopeptidase [Luethyella okanaganae]|uniref:D-alanyl-D-alanine carboxypeptidase family protein n=1 Tax=Luethyella okanaganae TaxID=69372 RepID=A0ABW1VI69_9MICO
MSESRRSRGPSRQVRRRRAVVAAGAVVALVVVGVVLAGILSVGDRSQEATSTPIPSISPAAAAPRPTPSQSPDPSIVPTFDKNAHSIDDPASIWVVVNKLRPLNPVDYAPDDLVEVPVPYVWQPQLRQEASAAVVTMFDTFTQETGLELQSQSAYRSYSTQVEVYDQDVATNGQEFADTSTARPGSSEHQTGLVIDISAKPSSCSLAACFGETPHGQWLAANAWRFGFILRYPADKTEITGFAYEPWHFRYIGVDLSTEMHETGVATLEEFFGLPAAPNYG